MVVHDVLQTKVHGLHSIGKFHVHWCVYSQGAYFVQVLALLSWAARVLRANLIISHGMKLGLFWAQCAPTVYPWVHFPFSRSTLTIATKKKHDAFHSLHSSQGMPPNPDEDIEFLWLQPSYVVLATFFILFFFGIGIWQGISDASAPSPP